VSHLSVAVVGELAKGVKDVEFWVGDRDETQRQRDSPPDYRLAIPQEVAKCAVCHFCTNVLTHGDKSNTDDCNSLPGSKVLFLVLLVFLFVVLLILFPVFSVMLLFLLKFKEIYIKIRMLNIVNCLKCEQSQK
jgi:hypothetical protein